MDPMAAPIITALFPGGIEAPDPKASEVDQSGIDRVVNQHSTLDIVEAQALSARLRAGTSGP